MQCYSAYRDITRDDLGNEGLVFQMFLGANRKDQSSAGSQRDEIIKKLASIPEEDRLRLCSAFIFELNDI